ncbi:MAG: 16S rRNA (guanine(966)-N(2))-methyltransferase RsmD [Acidobacteria bacterium]|nr:16S rRNA (guanine(966)-N(2))-methyltransferase RsmD [Acidobacteriota bacterium]
MRVIGGDKRGFRLSTGRRGRFRPSAERIRKSFFDFLGERVVGVRFLDCFAGSGAMGIEALSRGAEVAIFIEENEEAIKVIELNLRKCGFRDRSLILPLNYERALNELKWRDERFDILFFDPPYHRFDYLELLALVADGRLISEGGLAAFEHFHKLTLPEVVDKLIRVKLLRGGDSFISVYQLKED